MNKEDFIKATKNNDFIIYTDNAVGKGINGVSYTKYYHNANYTDLKQTTKVVKVSEDSVLLKVNNIKQMYPLGEWNVLIPLKNVVAVYYK